MQSGEFLEMGDGDGKLIQTGNAHIRPRGKTRERERDSSIIRTQWNEVSAPVPRIMIHILYFMLEMSSMWKCAS